MGEVGLAVVVPKALGLVSPNALPEHIQGPESGCQWSARRWTGASVSGWPIKAVE
jgi:hypothetical protein